LTPIGCRSVALIILSLGVLWNVPAINAGPIPTSLIPKNFEVNAIAVSPHGDVAAGSFYAMDPSVIPWDLTNSIYRYVGVTLIVSNSNTTTLASTIGINVPTSLPSLLPFKAILIIQGVQLNAPQIASDIGQVFGMPSGSFVALTSNPVSLPLSVFGAGLTPTLYSNFVNKLVQGTNSKSLVIGKYSASLLEQSSSGIVFNSVESLTYPLGGLVTPTSLSQAIFGASFDIALGVNSTGVIVLQKNHLDFSQATDHTLNFASVLGLVTALKSTTNETFVTVLPGGAQVISFSPSTMVIQSSPTATLVLGLFPWVGSAQRMLPDVSVTFHYPAFNSPVLNASWTTSPTPFHVGQNFTLSLSIANIGAMNAQKLHFDLFYSEVYSWDNSRYYGGRSSTISYDVSSITIGGVDTHNFNFLALSPDAGFTISASYLDTDSFAYSWNTVFSVAAEMKTGPLTVTKSVTPSSPVYGRSGNITFSITNNDPLATFWNMIDLTPEASFFLYPNGLGGGPTPSNGACPNLYNLEANTTQFSFELSDYSTYCGSIVVTQLWVGNQTNLYPVALQGNIPLGPTDTWAPVFDYPAGAEHRLYGSITIQLMLQNYGLVTLSSQIATGPLTSLGDPIASYLSLNCSLCPVGKDSWSPAFSGSLVNGTGTPISTANVQLSYTDPKGLSNVLGTAVTDSMGQFSFSWAGESQLALGSYQFTAFYAGSIPHGPRSQSIQFDVVEPTIIGPGKTITMSYPYFFNVTGPLTIEPERIAYSTRSNVTIAGNVLSLVGEYEAQSSPVTVTVSPPPIFPVVDTTMDAPKLSFLYVAQNQSLIVIIIRVTNTGPLTTSKVNVTSFIPRPIYNSYYLQGQWLPVVDNGNVTVDKTRGTVSFSVASLSYGQEASAWYVVRANSTNLFESSTNDTAQAPDGSRFSFFFSSPLLEVYSPFSVGTSPPQGLLENYVTTDPAIIANGTSTTVTFHLYNAGNVTYHSINVTIQYIDAGLTLDRKVGKVPDMAPGASQTINFTVSYNGNVNGNWAVGSFAGYLFYNQTSTIGFNQYLSQEFSIYNSKIAGLNPNVRIDVSATTPVPAGATDIAVVTVTNTGLSDVTNFLLNVRALDPFGTTPETSYEAYYGNWPGTLSPNQSIKFRIGIQTRAGGTYIVFSYANYDFVIPGSPYTGRGYITGSSAAVITASDTAGPGVTIPWAAPFAPTFNEPENVWTQVSDSSGIGSVRLEYSTDKQTWKPILMTPLIGASLSGQGILQLQSIFDDIYNATIPAQSGGTIVFYHIRAFDRLGNLARQDYGGVDFSYTVQGGSNNIVIPHEPGTNIFLNLSQSVPTLKATITLNVSTPIAIQVTQLSLNPGAGPPSGKSALGIYVQINANVSVSLAARVRLYYANTQVQGLNASSVTPYYWDGTSWVALSNVVVNTSQMWVEGTVTHFSLFGVFASPPTPAQPPRTTTPAAQLPWLLIGAVFGVIVIAAVGGLFYRTRSKKERKVSSLEIGPSTPSPPAGAPPTL
jgi:hypothetical protein